MTAVSRRVQGILDRAQRNFAPRAYRRGRTVRVMASGIFDVDFYQTQVGSVFATRDEAVDHFLTRGMGLGFFPHPLIVPTYFPKLQRTHYRQGRFDAFLTYLRSEEAKSHAWGPQFDPVAFDSNESRQPLEVLRALSADDVLPPNFGIRPATVANLTRKLSELAVTKNGHAALYHPGRYTTWDETAESQFLSTLPPSPTLSPNNPVVSVIMPVWNRAELVSRAIASVQNQSLAAWELIVVDDGSTDQTPQVLAELAQRDERVRIVRQERGGVGNARNRGIEVARGQYVAFLDSDNTWRHEFLEVMFGQLERSQSRAATAALRMTSETRGVEYFGSPVDRAQLLVRNYVDLNTLVVERAVARESGGFDPAVRRWNDHDFIIRVAAETSIDYYPFIGCDYLNEESVNRISTKESPNWQYVVLGKNITSWGSRSAPVAGRVSVIVIARDGQAPVVQAVNSLLDDADSSAVDVEVVVVDAYSTWSVAAAFAAAFAGDGRVRVESFPSDYGDAILANTVFSGTTGETVAFLDSRLVVRSGWLESMLTRLEHGGKAVVQSVVAEADGTVHNAGFVAVADGHQPFPYLSGLPLTDAASAGDVALTACSRLAMVVSARLFEELRGFFPLYVNGLEDVDFSLRAADAGARMLLASSAVAAFQPNRSVAPNRRSAENSSALRAAWSHRLRENAVPAYGIRELDIVHVAPASADQGTGPEPILARLRSTGTPAHRKLRWAIKIGADFTPGGDKWGDVPFAADLSDALQHLGHDVVVDRQPAFNRRSAYLDDVVLGIRGRHPIEPQPGKVNLLWVISRPDLVTPEELIGFDAVFAASPKWARYMTGLSGLPIEVLLQATSPSRFHPNHEAFDGSDTWTFVGGPRPPIGRQIVQDAIDAGAPVRLWGPRWPDFVDESLIAGDRIGADEVSAEYATSKVVLNDHFEDMRDWGFVNNRLFDAVASGARVVSDDVEGIEDIFGSSVLRYADVEDLRALLSPGSLDSAFPSAEERLLAAADVARRHSFDARATRLDEVVRQILDV